MIYLYIKEITNFILYLTQSMENKYDLSKFIAKDKTIQNTRYFPSAIKEWSNSFYSYNKNEEKDILYKDQICSWIITNYFNLKIKPVINTKDSKSKRMRDLINKSTTKQIITSRPFIKQNSNSVNIVVYIHDRERKNVNKKLYFLTNKLNYIRKMVESNENNKKIKSKENFVFNTVSGPKTLNSYVLLRPKKSKLLRFRKEVFKHKINFLNYKNLLVKSMDNKKIILNSIFMFYFLNWVLSVLGVYINLKYDKKGEKILGIIIGTENRLIIKHLPYSGLSKTKDTNIINTDKNNKLGYFSEIPLSPNNLNRKHSIKLINVILIKYIYSMYNKCYGYKPDLLYLFNIYKKDFYKNFSLKYFYKQFTAIKLLYKIYLNKFKTGKLLHGLKYFISNLYNKKVSFNIINLKYLSMNTDIFIKGISIKLRNRKSSYTNLIKKSLKLVKIPSMNLLSKLGSVMRENRDIRKSLYSKSNLFNTSFMYKGLEIKNIYNSINDLPVKAKYGKRTQDKLNIILKNLFGDNIINNNIDSYTSILNVLKYKWITGVRIEARGRLTKRYAAERSKYIFKYKGNLKNKDYIDLLAKYRLGNLNTKYIVKPVGTYNLRNDTIKGKCNIDYGFISSKKHVGTFGLKAWLSTN